MTDSTNVSPEGEIPKAPPVTGLPEANPIDTNLAGFGLRLAGYLIDGVIVFVGFLVIAQIAAGLNSTLLTIAASFAGFLYAGLLIGGWNGQTVGMKAMRIRCVSAADASSVAYSTSFLRAFIHAIFEIIPIVLAVDLLWPLWDARNQTLHDKVASTIVVKD